MWNYGMHMGGMWLWGLLVLGLIAAAAWAGAHATAGGERGSDPADSPETILKRRYARGEIDREDYDRRLADLRR